MVTENSPYLVVPLYFLIIAIGIILILKLSKDKTRKYSSLRLFVQVAAVLAYSWG
jgi:hypothetical protein